MKSLVSIIIPVYNVEKYIEKCLLSVLNQEYENIEIIVVNDGSTDNSKFYIDKVLNECKRNYRIINQKNKGLSDARNKGIEIAKGEYIFLLDSDDYIKSNVISLMVKKIEEDNSDIVIGKFNIIRNGKIMKSNIEKLDENLILDNIQGLKSLFSSGLFHFHAWGKLYRRELFNNVRYPSSKYYEDIATTYKLIYNSKKISLINISTCEYVMRNDSICNCDFKNKHLDFIEHINEMEKFLIDKEIYTNIYKDFVYMKIKTYIQLGFNKIASSNMPFKNKIYLCNKVKLTISKELQGNIRLGTRYSLYMKLMNTNMYLYVLMQIFESKLKKIIFKNKSN